MRQHPPRMYAPGRPRRPEPGRKLALVVIALVILILFALCGFWFFSRASVPDGLIDPIEKTQFQMYTGCWMTALLPVLAVVLVLFFIGIRKPAHRALREPEEYMQSREDYLTRRAAHRAGHAPDAIHPDQYPRP